MSRRVFVFVPRDGLPHALGHAIEAQPWRRWPAAWPRATYSAWRELEAQIAEMVRGKRIAMEYSAGDAVPYLDRVPAGVMRDGARRRRGGDRLVGRAGDAVLRGVERRAPRVAPPIGRDDRRRSRATRSRSPASERAVTKPATEHELVQWILDRFARAGLSTDHGPSVCAGANSANPHYEASAERPREIREGDVLLVDLWATEPEGIWADQTWMAHIGAPSARAQEVWTAVRDARDAAIRLVQTAAVERRTLRGAEVDDAARQVIVVARLRRPLHPPHRPLDRSALAPRRRPASRQPRDARGAPPHPRRRLLDRAGHLSAGRVRDAERGERVPLGARGGGDADRVSAELIVV